MTLSLKAFVEYSGAFWSEIAPLLPNLVRQINVSGYERVFAPVKSETDQSRHFLINDAAFDLAVGHLFTKGFFPSGPDPVDVFRRCAEKWEARFGNTPMTSKDMTFSERAEVIELANRLSSWVRTSPFKPIHAKHICPGVGRLETVEIDLVGTDFLLEVKAGERPFRSTDFRQLLAICLALGQSVADVELILFNPREGVVWSDRARRLIEASCIMTYEEFLQSGLFFLSESGLSI